MAVSGEIRFSWLGFGFQFASLVFDANRLVMVQILLSDSGQKMDPLVSLYYFAPACAVMTSLVAWQTEYASFEWSSIAQAGWTVLTLSAVMGFMLNVSIFLLVRFYLKKTMLSADHIDRKNVRLSDDPDQHS
jgi:hypothetical protein